MAQESVSNEEQIFVFTGKTALMDHEVTFTFITLVQVLFWVELENIVAHLESNWLYLRGYVFTGFFHVAEGLI